MSFLLTRGCSPAWTTSKGLTALDIVEGMPNREDVTDLLNGVGDAAAMMSPDPNASAVNSPAGPSNLQEEMRTPQTNFSPNFSIATEEPEEMDHQDTALRDRRFQALERNRRLKRAAKERKARRDRRRAEDEQVDLGVRMRLLNLGLGEDEAAYLMRDYETKWTKDDIQLRVRRNAAMDEDDDESSEEEEESDEEDEYDETMDDVSALDELLDDTPTDDLFGHATPGRADADSVDMVEDEIAKGVTLQSLTRQVSCASSTRPSDPHIDLFRRERHPRR